MSLALFCQIRTARQAQEDQMGHRIVSRFQSLLEEEATTSLDRGETQAQWLEALEETRALLDEEIAAVRESVSREEKRR